MAIQTGLCFSFKKELFEAIHNFPVDTFKAALYTSAASISPASTVYTAVGEVPTGGGYTAGGLTLTGATVNLTNGTAFVDFDDAIWVSSNITATGVMVYNASKANRAVFTYNFGTIQSSSGNFNIKFPSNLYNTAIIRI